jgi:double-strand break repair protein MRE11
VLEEIVLTEVAEEEGFEINDQMEIAKYLKAKVGFDPSRQDIF